DSGGRVAGSRAGFAGLGSDRGDSLQGLVRLGHREVAAADQVSHGHDPLQSALLVDDRDPPDLVVLHQLDRLRHRVVRRAGDDDLRHARVHGDRARITALGDDVHAQVAIGDDAHDLETLFVVDDGDDAGVLVAHDPRRANGVIGWQATARILRHDVLDSHECTSPLVFRREGGSNDRAGSEPVCHLDTRPSPARTMQHEGPMRVRHRVALVVACVLVASAVSLYWLPEIARRVAVARIHVLTQRRVTIEAVELGLLTGSVTLRGLRLDEAGEPAAFASFERLDVRLHLPSLLLGHVWIRELILSDSIVRVVRLPTGDFNFSDLIRSSGASTRVLDVTVDRFAVGRGTVTLEDRAVAEPRTWASEQIAIEARNLSTRRDDGSAVARSLTAGAPVSIDVSNLRLYPIHLQATVTIAGVDLTPLRVYFPPDAPIIVERGRASSTLAVTLDARDGLRADATGRLEDVVLVRPEGGEPLALVPTLTARVAGFGYREGDLRLAGLAVEGAMRVRDPAAPERYPLSRVRATAADLTWPPRTHGRLDLGTTIPGGGTLALDGTLVPPPAASNLHLRVAGLALAPWTRMLPVAGRITGLAEADLRMNEPLAAGMPARVHGSIVVNRFGLADGRRELLGAGRIEARGLEVHWPTRLVVERVLISGPRGIVERDRAGAFPLASIVAAPREAEPAPAAPTPPLAVEIREVAVRDGRMAWRDETVSPVADLVVSGVEAAVTGVAWPARGPLGVRAGLRPPGGGALRVTGRVALDPL